MKSKTEYVILSTNLNLATRATALIVWTAPLAWLCLPLARYLRNRSHPFSNRRKFYQSVLSSRQADGFKCRRLNWLLMSGCVFHYLCYVLFIALCV